MLRRTFLQVASLSPFVLNSAFSAEKRENDKSVVLIWLGGGASQYEFTHPNSDGLDGFKSVNGAINTNVSGMDIDSLWANLAKQGDRLSIVRSCSHSNANHEQATHFMQTAVNLLDNNPTPQQKEPGLGSICASYHGSNRSDGMPNFVQASSDIFGSNGMWLGNQYNPFVVNKSGDLALNVDMDRVKNRKDLLSGLDRLQNRLDDKRLGSVDEFRKQGYNMLLGNVKDAFKLNDEEQKLDQFSKELRLAAKVVERGSMFVTLHFGGWDMHSSIAKSSQDLIPKTDYAIGQFLNYLYESGLASKTLVVIATEFGRTKLNAGNPAANDANPGRDHHSGIIPLVFSGGGLNHGRIIGSADKRAVSPTSDIYGPNDIGYTILTYLGLPKDYQRVDSAGRPRYMVPDGKFILS